VLALRLAALSVVLACAAIGVAACGFGGLASRSDDGADSGGTSRGGREAGDDLDASSSDAQSLPDGGTVVLDDAALPPELSLHVTTAPAMVDLEAEGTLAWQHWGKGDENSRNEKSTAKGAIPTWTVSNTGDVRTFDDFLTTFRWTNGSPNATESGTQRGVYAKFDGPPSSKPKLTLAFKVGVERRRLVIYAGTYRSKGHFAVTLSSPGSMKTVFQDIDSASDLVNDKAYGRFAIDYRGAAPMADLVVTWEIATSYDDNNANITLCAATMMPR